MVENEISKLSSFDFFVCFYFSGCWLGRLCHDGGRKKKLRSISHHQRRRRRRRRRRRLTPFRNLLVTLNCTQVHVGTAARQGGIWKRECFSLALLVSLVGGGEGDSERAGPFSSLEEKKNLFHDQQVRVVTDKRTGTEFAAKSIPKRLDAPGLAPERQAAHVDNIRREVAVLRRLRGTLNVVALEGAFEDSDSVHIVMVRGVVNCLYSRERGERERQKKSTRERERAERGKPRLHFFSSPSKNSKNSKTRKKKNTGGRSSQALPLCAPVRQVLGRLQRSETRA